MARAGEADVSPDVLDDLEQTICASNRNWTGALEELAKGNGIPIEELAGQRIDSAARRDYLQQRLDAALTGAQKQLAAEFQRQFGESQQRYRALVGHDFDLAACGLTDRRIERRQAWERKRHEAALQQQAEALAGSEASMVSAACRELAIIKGPPPDTRSAFRERDIQSWQAAAREGLARLSRAYEARTGKSFDPARCPGPK